MLLKRELLFKNLFQFITYIHIPDHITVTTDDEDDNSAGPSGVRQGNVVIHVIEMETLISDLILNVLIIAHYYFSRRKSATDKL